MSVNTGITSEFTAAWKARDVEKIMSFFTADCVYHNIPMEPLRGTEAIRGLIQTFVGMASELEFIVHHIAETSSGTVLTERTDKFLIDGKWVELPVMGTFEFRDGKISAWRDYFDLEQFNKQMPKS
jgi:limonene-1,2-epoxide hydrolase